MLKEASNLKLSAKVFIHISLLILFTNSFEAHSYDRKTQKKFYLSESFRQNLNKYCNFSTSLVATARREIKSLDQAYKIIAKISDLPNKASWSDDIDAKKSFLVYEGDNSFGMIYHFAYKENLNPLLGITEGYSDYYRDISKKDYFKGCILNTSSTLKNAVFEYKIVQENSTVYIQRTVRIIPKINFPISLAKAKLAQSNKESLDKAISLVKS